MSFVQWMFHYLEVCKLNGGEQKLLMDNLSDIQTSIQAFYLLVDDKRGPKLIDTLNDIKKKRVESNTATTSKDTSPSQDKNNDDNLPDLLNNDDKELWEFMQTLPETMVPGEGMKEEIKPILPTRSKKDIIKAQTKVVDKIKDEEKPKLGF